MDERAYPPAVVVPMKTKRGLNDREHFMARYRRTKAEHRQVAFALRQVARPSLPCTVTLVRLTPGGSGLDDDNLVGALKSTRDAVARWLRVDDSQAQIVRYRYSQGHAPAWAVRIIFGEPGPGMQLALEVG
jgi:hypothetical protein